MLQIVLRYIIKLAESNQGNYYISQLSKKTCFNSSRIPLGSFSRNEWFNYNFVSS